MRESKNKKKRDIKRIKIKRIDIITQFKFTSFFFIFVLNIKNEYFIK